MKVTKKQIKTIVREAVRRQLDEVYGISEYERMLQLKSLYEDDFIILDRVGPELYRKIYDYREQAADFDEFKKLVAGMPARIAKDFWEWDLGKVNVELLEEFKREFEELKTRFSEEDATTEADRVYGRKRTKVVDNQTGEIVGTMTNRRGSLGS